jgi:hypothetical protein
MLRNVPIGGVYLMIVQIESVILVIYNRIDLTKHTYFGVMIHGNTYSILYWLRLFTKSRRSGGRVIKGIHK